MNNQIEVKEIGSYQPKFVVCYSGGHSSAICAINAVLRHGKENVILLNHDIHPKRESEDTKRFKREVADYLGMEITYANHERWNELTPVGVCLELGGWKFNESPILCTYHLKTLPFYKWIEENDPEHLHTYIYGFDNTKDEIKRMNRRIGVMAEINCKTDYPLVTWGKLEVTETEKIGIHRPNNYENFKHANCLGCLKAGWQHWYIIYVHRPDIWQEAKEAEDEIGYAIHKDSKTSEPVYLEDREELFEKMKLVGVPTTEHIPHGKFWSLAKKWVKDGNLLYQIYDAMGFDESMACTSCTG